MGEARYDSIADFYEAGWSDSYEDAVTVELLEQLEPLQQSQVLDVACGHGRISREMARRGAQVLGVDISRRLLDRAEASEHDHPLGVRYLCGDISSPDTDLEAGCFDLAVCSFGLSDIDGLDDALHVISLSLKPAARFVFSILHPCFPGGDGISGAWPTSGSYYDEGWWVADGELSKLRHQVGANHRTLSTYVNTLRSHNFSIERFSEPMPPADWQRAHSDVVRHPVFLVVNCSSA